MWSAGEVCFIYERLTLAAREPYSDSVFMIMARRSTMPQLWRVFATARAPMSSTSEKMSVSMIIGLGLSELESEFVVAYSKKRSTIRCTGIENIVASMQYMANVVLRKSCVDRLDERRGAPRPIRTPLWKTPRPPQTLDLDLGLHICLLE